MLKVSLKDRAFGHSNCVSNPTVWVNAPKFMEWDRTSPPTLNTVYTDAEIFTAPDGIIAWLIEPIHNRQDAYDFLLGRAPNLKEIWTCDRTLLEMIPNGVFVPCGGCWIPVDDRRIWPKTRNISIIASNKRGCAGYDLRHESISSFRSQIEAYGIEYTPLEFKIGGLRDYRFHVVFENVKCDYYFTEKLIDCFATGTIPIYRGCPSIGNFFNLEGMIIIDTIDDLAQALPLCTPEFYAKRQSAIADNFERARQFYLTEDWLCINRMTEMNKLAV